jgi:DUF4097 and DUF4098 domain-containing protein YvlB
MSVYGYRRGSIFWALTLIGVGVIFLWQNFNPAVHPWRIIAKYWPLLIIFWGVSKLVDYLQARAHPETAPPSLFSGSEVVLLGLILLLGTIVSKIVLRPWQHWGGINVDDDEISGLFLNSYTFESTLSQPVKPQPHLVIEDQRGDLEIRGSDQPNIEVVAKKVVRAEDENEAKKISDRVKIEIVEQAGHYLLQCNRRSLPEGERHVKLDMVVRLPKSASAEVTSELGDVNLDGLRGDQTVTASHGDVHLSNIDGLIRAHKTGGLTEIRDVKGSVDLDGRGNDVDISSVTGTVSVNGEFSGDVQFGNIGQTLRFRSSRTDLTAQKLSGRLNMDIGSLNLSGIDGPLEISTRQKDITVDEFKHSVKISDSNGDVQLRTSLPPTHAIEIDLKKGQIELALPPASSFQIEASSRKGEVECDFSGPSLKVVKEGDNPSIIGTIGKGGPLVRLTTEYGAIRVLREGAHPPSPPSPPSAPGKQVTRLYHPVRSPLNSAGQGWAGITCEPARRVAWWISSIRGYEAQLVRGLSGARTNWDWACPLSAK